MYMITFSANCAGEAAADIRSRGARFLNRDLESGLLLLLQASGVCEARRPGAPACNADPQRCPHARASQIHAAGARSRAAAAFFHAGETLQKTGRCSHYSRPLLSDRH